MNALVEAIFKRFARSGRTPDATELAEILWLLDAMGLSELDALVPQDTTANPPESVEHDHTHVEEPPPQSAPTTRNEPTSSSPPMESHARPRETSHKLATQGAGTSVNISVPALATHTEALFQAFRPLRANTPSRRRVLLDEEATANNALRPPSSATHQDPRALESLGWTTIPVEAPVSERWFRVQWVVDESPASVLWQSEIQALEAALRRRGGFRSFMRWSLDTQAETPTLFRGTAQTHTRRVRSHQQLVACERPLVFIVSDCTSRAWSEGTLGRWIRTWGQHATIAIVQLLPEQLWTRTRLRAHALRSLKSLVRGATLAQMNDAFDGLRAIHPDQLLVPVIELKMASILSFSQTVMQRRNEGVIAATVSTSPSWTRARKADPTPEERVHRFALTSSRSALELATLLSAVPLTVSVMRLVREQVLPTADPSHLAEFFLSGLIRPKPSTSSTPAEREYEFVPGVRERLRDLADRNDLARALARVSDEEMQRTGGQSWDFKAILRDPLHEINQPEQDDGVFALLGAAVLDKLGGAWADAARKIKTTLETRPPNHAREEMVESLRWIQIGSLLAEKAGLGIEKLADDVLSNANRADLQPILLKDMDLLVLTGDATRSGTASQLNYLLRLYRQLSKYYQRVGRPAPELFYVPGNREHSEPLDSTGLLLRDKCVSEGLTSREIAQLREYVRSSPRLAQFQQLLARVEPAPTWHGLLPGDKARSLELHGRKYLLIGLNTAFFEAPSESNDRAGVLLPEQFDVLFESQYPQIASEHDCVILVMHHPWDRLHPHSRKQLLRSGVLTPVSLCLSGIGLKRWLRTSESTVYARPRLELQSGSLESAIRRTKRVQPPASTGFAVGSISSTNNDYNVVQFHAVHVETRQTLRAESSSHRLITPLREPASEIPPWVTRCIEVRVGEFQCAGYLLPNGFQIIVLGVASPTHASCQLGERIFELRARRRIMLNTESHSVEHSIVLFEIPYVQRRPWNGIIQALSREDYFYRDEALLFVDSSQDRPRQVIAERHVRHEWMTGYSPDGRPLPTQGAWLHGIRSKELIGLMLPLNPVDSRVTELIPSSLFVPQLLQSKARVSTPDDPQAGLWGGRSEAHGHQITASLETSAPPSSLHTVTVRVTNVTSKVTLFLHSHYSPPERDVEPQDGVATWTSLVSGPFVIGALVHSDHTLLELDLASIEGASEAFLSR